jgi:hypothetical protein
MKLASFYTPVAHVVPNNSLYGYYQDFFHDGLRDPKERDPIKETVSLDKYKYEISETEKEFYEKFYVPQGNILEVKEHSLLKKIFGEKANQIVIGEHVKDFLDFINIQKNLGLLIAPIGWGKTVLIRYIWFYLINQSEELQKKVIPIYMSIDHNRNSLQASKTSNQIKDIFVTEILRERIIDITKPFTQLDNEEFWNYLMKGSDRFNTLEQYEEDVKKLYAGDFLTQQSHIFAARMDARKMDDFYPIALKYIRDRLGKTPILILDNVDTLPLDVNQIILDETIFLSQEYNLKIIISMRASTHAKIMETRDGSLRAYPPAMIIMEKPNVKKYLKYRTASIRHKIREAKSQFKYVNYEGDIQITFRDGVKVFDAMLEMLLGEESSNVLSFIANYNLRKVNSLVLKYLATGYIDEHMFVKKIVEEEVNEEKLGKSPLWILLSSVITSNYKTRFSEVGMSHQEGVLNLYCNGRSRPGEYLVRLHVLNYVKRHRDINVQDVINTYLQLNSASSENVTDSIKYAVWRLLSFDLLDSPDYYKAELFEDINRVKSITITETGDYYRQEFRNFYEYLVYMKDDIELSDNSFGIRDCIKVGDLSGRLTEVYKLLRMIYEAEKEFLFSLDKNKRVVFVNNFSVPEDLSPFIVAAPVASIVNFSKTRLENINTETLQKYETLLAEVYQNAEKFHKTITG